MEITGRRKEAEKHHTDTLHPQIWFCYNSCLMGDKNDRQVSLTYHPETIRLSESEKTCITREM